MFSCTVRLQAQNPQHERMKPVIEYLKKSEILSPEIKAGCGAHPEFFFQISVELVELFLFAAIRPDAELVDQAIEKVKKGKLELVDFLTLYNCYMAYGETTIDSDTMIELYSEPTRKERDWRERYNMPYYLTERKEFESSLKKIHSIIQTIGQRMGWEWDKINTEIDAFDKRAASYLLTHFQGCTTYSSAFYNEENKVLDLELNEMEKKIEIAKKEREDIYTAIREKKESNMVLKRKCDELAS